MNHFRSASPKAKHASSRRERIAISSELQNQNEDSCVQLAVYVIGLPWPAKVFWPCSDLISCFRIQIGSARLPCVKADGHNTVMGVHHCEKHVPP